MPLRLTRRASNDLADIYAYGDDRWGRRQAEAYAASFWKTAEAIAAHPLAARLREEATPPVRVARLKAHLIVYREQDGDVLVIRIAHARSDWLNDLG